MPHLNPDQDHLDLNMRHVLSTGLGHDFEIIYDDHHHQHHNQHHNQHQRTFKCHKAVLSSRCEFFNIALRSGMNESKKGVMKLNQSLFGNLSVENFQKLLIYLYTHQTSHIVEFEDALEIYCSLGFYGIPNHSEHVKIIGCCELIIWKHVSVNTVLDILKAIPSTDIFVQKLKSKLVRFIVEKYSEVAKQEAFSELPRSLYQMINTQFNLSLLKMIQNLANKGAPK
eukprot:TRINITY_DN1343_c0_g1_i3.p1 TRINITY_DN1343_c0_g1~~TRINITY_DN1343_c0_g1_i3.p1  ORF type:complete len:226 (-),score=34.42 TRINITY_DN1343_c0_g1_i3:15-692(-)